jgi:hypothetical protein
MRKTLFFIAIFIAASGLWGQQKYALVIGNGNYIHVGKLNNPVNDANDVAVALQGMGFDVDKVLNGSLDQMESAAIRLKNRLSAAKNSYGFLFYAGHGVQSGGENYLIPVDANIQSESFLRQRAVSVQAMLDELNDAGNQLNVVVLDACRDNPFSWKRSGSRGLSVVGQQPADSIIVFATSAGSTASDGTDRNGLFTTHLLNNLKTSGLEVSEVFRRTGSDVSRASNRQQIPAVYNQFFETAYLGTRPSTPAPQPAPVVTPAAPPVQPAPTPASTPIPTSTPVIQATPQTAPTVSPDSKYIVLADAEWTQYVNAEKESAKKETTVQFSIANEEIGGQVREVLTLETNLGKGSGWKIGSCISPNEKMVQTLQKGSGVRFKVLGDGKNGN